jgi:hypothetical protein
MFTIVPSFSRHLNSACGSQTSNVSVLSHLVPFSSVDLLDNYILIPVSNSAHRVIKCRYLVRVYRNEYGRLLTCLIEVILDRLSRLARIRVEASFRLVSRECTSMLAMSCLRVFVLNAKED